ncbi:MAG: outer membrane beta-barrel protein [Thermoguttaceae bacterium]|nr:outer membrane beta-barrel protein [Thermoguttaceae bacterium]
MTKTAVFSAIAVLAFSALPASAQTVDNFVKRLAPPPSVSVAPNPLSWGGFYFGAGWGREKKSLDQGTAYQTLVPGGPGQPSNEPVSLATTNYLNRGHILGGYLWQYERFLLGAEGDYSFGDRVPTSIPFGAEPGYCGVGTTGNYICGSPTAFGSVETRGHVRGVAGLAITPSFMAFVSGGAAFGRSDTVGSHVGFALAASPSAPALVSGNSLAPNKNLVGTSIGGGIQVKASENLIARLEYLKDTYNDLTTSGAVVQANVNGNIVTMTSPSEKVKVTTETIRASLIYRFDPNESPSAAAALNWRSFTTDPALYANTWAGFYVGGGLTQNNYTVKQEGGMTLTIDDITTPGLDVSRNEGFARKMDRTGDHLLLGYRAQWNRFWLGVEGDFEFNSLSSLVNGKSPGQFGGASGANMTCYVFTTATSCVGLAMAGNLSVESKNHLRLMAGFVITPQLSGFFSYGKSYGTVSGSIGSSSGGLVISPPSAPLAGAATVTRTFAPENLIGTTIGGGFEYKATDDLSVRGEYLRDTYTWSHLPIGGAGFGGTIGNVTTNGFAAASNVHQIVNEAYRVSLVYRFINPQGDRFCSFCW